MFLRRPHQCLKSGDHVEEFFVDATLAQLVEVAVKDSGGNPSRQSRTIHFVIRSIAASPSRVARPLNYSNLKNPSWSLHATKRGYGPEAYIHFSANRPIELETRRRESADTGARNGPKGGALHEAVRFHYLSRRRSGVADRAGAFIGLVRLRKVSLHDVVTGTKSNIGRCFLTTPVFVRTKILKRARAGARRPSWLHAGARPRSTSTI